MASADQSKEAARRRKANQRARDRGLPEPYSVTPIQEEAEKSAREQQHLIDLAWAQQQDATGRFYKAECRSAVRLLAVYEGNNYVGTEDPDVIDPKTGQKKQNIPNPSIQAVRIRAIKTEVDGVVKMIDPDMLDYRHLMEVSQVLTFQEWLDYRDKGRRDLFWLSNVLGKGLFYNSHKVICEQFIQKDFDGKYYLDFDRHTVSAIIRDQKRETPEGVPTRTAMVFAPRGGWKSTIDGIDAVQWMLNAPDIRIMIITAFRDLSKQFLKEIKGYFYLPPRGEATAFQLLYPEYILTGVDGRSREPIVCPAAVLTSKEPHLWVTSMESSVTGKRCDICKADDIVDPKNSTDEVLRQGLVDKFNGALDLVEPWGLVDIIGTRYFTDDYYGTRMSPDDDGVVAPFTLLSISAWYPKTGFERKYAQLLEDPSGMSKVTEDMVDLWFPFKLDFPTLRRKLLEKKERGSTNIQKERSFRNQQLNIATDPVEVSELTTHFTREVLRAHAISAAKVPKTGESIVTIDWAYSDNKTSDYSVLAHILRHEREDSTQELFVTDIDYDKWKANDLALHIVLFLRKHNPQRTLLERALGADLLMMALTAHATRLGCLYVLQSIRFVETGNSKNAKTNRVKTLEILLADDRLHFVAGPWIDELYRQFERFTGETKKGRKDDIPDSISLASRTLPASMFITVHVDPETTELESEEQLKRLAKEAHYQKYFGNPPVNNVRKMSDFLPNRRTLTPSTVEPAAPKPQDPRMAIFGNKGPWRL